MTEDSFKRIFVATWLAQISLQRNYVSRKNWPVGRALRLADLAWKSLRAVEDGLESKDR
jgi:hypothetical protein